MDLFVLLVGWRGRGGLTKTRRQPGSTLDLLGMFHHQCHMMYSKLVEMIPLFDCSVGMLRETCRLLDE